MLHLMVMQLIQKILKILKKIIKKFKIIGLIAAGTNHLKKK